MPKKQVLPTLVRVCAVLVLLAGAACVVLLADLRAPVTAAKLAIPVLCALVSIGTAAGMFGIAAILARSADGVHPEIGRAIARINTQLAELGTRVDELRAASDRQTRSPAAAAPAPPAYSGIGPSDLEPLYQALYEIRELTMLPDAERRERLERHRVERRANLLKQAFELVAARQWQQAERTVATLEVEFASDDEVAKSRHYLNHSRRLHEQETVGRTTREIEGLLSSAAWDQALARARALSDGFPENADARELVARVGRERKAFEESNVQRMFDELRHDIDRRIWRRALVHAERLLEQYPDHPRADGVRRQLGTLQDNAEIEERQEQEVRIQELIKARRFNEAIELAEELLDRYPLSPQAESLELLLPRIRDLAESGVEESEFGGDQIEEDATHRPA